MKEIIELFYIFFICLIPTAGLGFLINIKVVSKLDKGFKKVVIKNIVRTLCYCPTVVTVGHAGIFIPAIIAIPMEVNAYGGGNIEITLIFPAVFFVISFLLSLYSNDFKTSEERIFKIASRYLGTPILVGDYCKKYKTDEETVRRLIGTGDLRAIERKGMLFIEDKAHNKLSQQDASNTGASA